METDKSFLMTVVFLVVLIIALIIFSFVIRSEHSLTELYFENYEQLPKKIELGKVYDFSFTVNNKNFYAREYLYSIAHERYSGSVIIDSGYSEVEYITLRPYEKRTVTASFKITNSFDFAKIKIKLINSEQEIHFWVEEE